MSSIETRSVGSLARDGVRRVCSVMFLQFQEGLVELNQMD